MVRDSKNMQDMFWGMVCIEALHYAKAPWGVAVGVICIAAALWGMHAWCDWKERQLDRKYPGWRSALNRGTVG